MSPIGMLMVILATVAGGSVGIVLATLLAHQVRTAFHRRRRNA